MKNKIFIFGYYGWGNVGDEAILYVLLNEFFKNKNDLEYYILSKSDTPVPSQVKDKVIFIKPRFLNIFSSILKSNVFLVGGGTHFFDYGNKKNAFIVISRIFLLILFSKIFRKKVVLAGVGIGPLNKKWADLMVKTIVYMSDYISVRDQTSYNYLINWKFEHKSSLDFDFSVLFPIHRKKIKKCSSKFIGLSITPIYDIYFNSKEKDDIIISKFSDTLNNWLNNNPEYKILLFVFHSGDHNSDIEINNLLKEKLSSGKVQIVKYKSSIKNFISCIDLCEVFIGMKYHSNLFAFINEKPLLIIEYHPKCRAFASEVNIPIESVVTLEDILDGKLTYYLDRFLKNKEEYKPKLSLKVAQERASRGIKNIIDEIL